MRDGELDAPAAAIPALKRRQHGSAALVTSALLAIGAACGQLGATAALAQDQAPAVPATPAPPGTLDATPEQIQPGPPIGSPRAGGAIVPPSGTDPGLVRVPPDGGTSTTPVIPPPGSPGGDPSVVPR